MKRSNRLVILVGVLLAVLAFVGIVILLNQQGGPAAQPEVLTETVLVAKEDIAIGEEVTPEKVEEQQVQVGAALGTPIRTVTAVGGRPALVNVPAGTQVNQETFGAAGVADIAAQLQPSERAIAFQVDRVTGLDFLIVPGNHIDIVVTQQITVLQETLDSAQNTDPAAVPRFEVVQGLENQRTVKTVLQNKRVLYVSATRNQPAATASPAPEGEQAAPQQIDTVIIVFAGTDKDAEVIKFAQSNQGEIGFITAVVRASGDDAEEVTTGVTLEGLVDEYGLRIPGVIQQLVEQTPQ